MRLHREILLKVKDPVRKSKEHQSAATFKQGVVQGVVQYSVQLGISGWRIQGEVQHFTTNGVHKGEDTNSLDLWGTKLHGTFWMYGKR